MTAETEPAGGQVPLLGRLRQHAQRLANGASSFAEDMRRQGIHVGMGNPAVCVNCSEPWPCPSQGPWRCGHTGEVWTGDISNHHGTPAGHGYCPGPHVREAPAARPPHDARETGS